MIKQQNKQIRMRKQKMSVQQQIINFCISVYFCIQANILNNASMLTSFPSSSNLLPRPTQQHLFTTISRGQQRFRILTRQCNQTITAICNLQIFWFIVGLVQVGAIFDHFLQARQGCIIFGFGFVGVLIAASAAILYRNKLIKMIVFSLVNLSLYLLACTIMLTIECKKLILPTCLYSNSLFISVIFQTLGSMALLRDRSKFMAKFLIMIQLLVLILKLDNKIQCQWVQVYFGFLLTCFIGIVILVSMALFWAVNVLYFNQQICSIKHIGLTFIFIQAFCCVMTSMLPITQVFFGISFLFASVTALIVNISTIFYARKFQTQIILFMCRVQKVKAYNQLITLVKIPNTSLNKYIFNKKSQNWYQRITKKQLQKQKTSKQPSINKQNPQSPYKIDKQLSTRAPQDSTSNLQQNQDSHNKCLICLELQPCMIWMPCGHMTLCELCCDQMFESKNCNCLLCKDIPQAVYHVSNQSQEMNKNVLQRILNGQIDIDGQDQIKQKAIKDLDAIQSSLSGKIDGNNVSDNKLNENSTNSKQQWQKGQILYIRSAYSIKIN